MVEKKVYRWLRFTGSVISLLAMFLPLYSYTYPLTARQFGGSWTTTPINLLFSVGAYSLPAFLASILLLFGIVLTMSTLRPKATYVTALGFFSLFFIGWQDMVSVSAHVVQFNGGFQVGLVILLFGVLCCLSEDIVRLGRFMASAF